MRRQTTYVLILALALFAGSYMGGRAPAADAAAKLSLKSLDARLKKIESRVKKLEARVSPVGDDAPAPLDERVAAIEEVLGNSGGDAATAGIWQIIKAQFGEEGDGAGGEVDRRFDALTARLSAVETTAPLLVAGKLASLADHYEYVPTTMDGLAGPHIIFKGANVHIRNAGGAETADSKGNLILGYDRIGIASGTTSYTVERTGSHTLVVGDSHSWKAKSGIVNGNHNTLGATSNTAVLGGMDNESTGPDGVIAGGRWNKILTGHVNAVLGGASNTIEAGAANAISGGDHNSIRANDFNAISGGQQNEIKSGNFGAILGGWGNAINFAGSSFSVLVGGSQNYSGVDYGIVTGGWRWQPEARVNLPWNGSGFAGVKPYAP